MTWRPKKGVIQSVERGYQGVERGIKEQVTFQLGFAVLKGVRQREMFGRVWGRRCPKQR